MRSDEGSSSGAHAAMLVRLFCRAAAGAAAVFALGLPAEGALAAQGQAADSELKDVSVDELKRLYLSCDRAASEARLNTTGIMRCSVVYEELKLRAFGGDYDKLRAWSKAQPTVQGGDPGPGAS